MSGLPIPRLFFWPSPDDKRKSSVLFRHKAIVALTGVALIAPGLSACQEETAAEAPPRPVKAVIVHEEPGVSMRSFSGDIRPQTESPLGFRIAGKIVDRLVDTGDGVAVGQVIARLDDTDLLLSEASARAAVQSAKTRLAVARDALARAQSLRPKGFTPQAILDQRQLETDAAEAALEAAEAQLRQAANATGYAVLKADKAGIVTALRAEAGQVVEAGAPVILLAETDKREVALGVPEQDVTHLALGQDADLSLWADPSVKARGRVSEIAGQADSGSRTYAVRVLIDNPPTGMRLGMTATATLKLADGSPFMAVPLTALTEIEGRKAVFVADRMTSKVTPRFIETSGVSAESVKVTRGLTPGDAVVTAGVQFLRDGMQVRLPPEIVGTASTSQR